MKKHRMRSAMAYEFMGAYKESTCDWISWCGGWMLYDGAVFVTREG